MQHWTAGQDVSLTQSHWPDEGKTNVGSGFAFGNTDLNLAAKTYDQDIWISLGSYTFYFEGFDKPDAPTVKLNLDDSNSLSVFEQSQGFDQALVHTTGLSIISKPVHFSVDSKNGIDSNIFEQLVEQNGNTVALGRYIIGERAVNLGVLDGRNWDDHNDKGIRYDDTTFYTAAVLSELDIYAGQALKLNVFGSQNWGAHLTGEGGVAYVGDNKAEDVVTIKQLYATNGTAEDDLNKDRLHFANDYAGATTVTGVTLNLERETSLGASGILTADNANIVEVKEGALGTLKKIDFTNTALTTAGTSLEVMGDATFEGENTMNVVDYFKVDNKATITSGSLSTGKAAFEAGTFEITGATLTASSVKVTGNATATGTNTLHADTVTVDGVAAVTSGSLLMDKAAFKAGTLDVTGATLTASSVEVSGNSTVSGKNTVTADTFKTQELSLDANATLDVAGSLTAGTAQLSAGTVLSAKEDVKVDGALTMQGSSITADTLTASGNDFTLSGVNTISTKGGATVENADVRLDDGVTLEVAAGGLAVNKNMMVSSEARLKVTGGLTVGETLTLDSSGVGEGDSETNFSADSLKVGKELVFEGESYSDNVYGFGTPNMTVSALNTSYDVSLKNANVEYAGSLEGVGKTTLDQAHLTLAYENAGSLGHVVMTNTSGSEKSQNLLKFKSDSGFVINNSFSVEGSAAEDVIELSGTGKVTFANNAFDGDNYNGWIRMTGTTVDLADALNSDPGLSLSVGRGGTIVYDESVARIVHRLGWTSEGNSELSAGVLDLSGVDFAQLDESEAVLKVQELVVSGPGTIRLNKSAVQNIGTSGAAQGDDIFDAISGGNSRLVIATSTGHDQEYYGSIDVKVEGADERPLTGFFDANGKFTGDTLAAALGTWGYTTVFSERGLEVTYGLDKLQLLAKNTQEGVGAFTLDTTQLTEHTDFGVTLTGSGDLNVEGAATGTLHLTGANTMTGTVFVKSGTLMAEAGSLGSEKEHASLDVAKGAAFQLNGVQNETKRQYLRSLTSKGDVTIGNANNTSLVVLELAEGGTLYADSRLKGGQNSVLRVMDETLTVEDLENVAATDSDDAFAGRIRLEDGATLSLTGTEDRYAADLSMVTGTGTIELRDSAIYATEDRTGSFTGTTKVLAGGKLDITGDAKVDAGAKLAMDGGESRNAEILSVKQSTFETIDLKNGTIDLGVATAGQGRASGSLNAQGQVTLQNVTLVVNADEAVASVDASGIFELGNSSGKTTWLLTGKNVVNNGGVTIKGIETDPDKPYTSELTQDGVIIGSVTHTLEEEFDKNEGIGFTTKASSIDLTGELKLAGNLEAGADSTLELQVTGSKSGSIHVTNNKVTLAAENTYGKLVVDDKAEAVLDKKQTLTQGGLISGKVSGEGGLDVTGGTLTVSETGSSNVAIRLDAEDETAGAELAFVNRKGNPVIYAGDVSAVSGARVSFADTTGDFSLASGTADYVLSGTSAVTFGPYADESALKDTFTLQDAESTAYLDITGAANSIDLSGVTGNGKLALNYAVEGGTLNVAKMNNAFEGTLAFANATATIGTDASLSESVLNKFATEQGELEVGAGSTLVVNNQKDRAEDGSFTPHVVTLAGDLTISDRATLDFTAGVFDDHGKDHLGNTSGLSVNALDLGGNRLVVTDSGDSKLTVRASIDKLDFGTGLPSNGEYHGSILDMLGETPDYPVLTVVTGIDMTEAELAAIASDMVLEGESDNSEHVVKFWQPNWDPNSSHETVHVADVHTGVRLVADKENNGIAIGAGITQIDIVSGATLRMDEAASAESGTQHIVDAEITGDGHVVVTNSLGTAGSDGIVFAGGNSYTGETKVDLGATLTAANANAFGGSSLVRVGTMETGDGTDPAPSTLKVSVAQSKTDAYANALKVNALSVGANGTVELAKDNDLLLTGNGTSIFAANSHVTGDASTTIGLADGNLTIENLESLSGFEGAFRVNTDASVNFTVADGSYTWTNDVLYYTDARSRAIGAGEFVKSGAGTLVIDGTQGEHDLSGMNLVVAEGTMKANQASILGLTTRAGTIVDVDGIFTTHNLTADAGSVFNLDVVTGKPFDVKEGESSSTIWGLGENGSDGILVTGTASGTLNLAVTPKDLKKGAEESIQLVDANRAAEGFTVSLVDEKGAKLEGLTAGAYDYTLVRKDDAQNGTDIFLSSIPGEDEKRNTTVTAGSYIGVAAAAQLFDISLHDRMSNRSWLTANADGSIANSFWVLETVSNERYGDSTGQIDVHDTASTTTVGSDILSGLAAGGTWYAGAMFSYATEDTKSRSNRTALESRADTDAWAAGLYAGWQLNGADRTGPYVDGWILWTDAESDVKGVNVSETVDGNGLSASIEAGWGFKALSYNAHGQAGDIYVEPHVSVTWFGYEADDVSNDVHDVTFEGKDNIRTKLGVKTYAFGKNSGGFSPYVELNWIHNTETYGVTMSNVTVEQVGAEDQGEVRAGADWRINDAFTVWGHFGITSGSDGYSNREASLGVRYNF